MKKISLVALLPVILLIGCQKKISYSKEFSIDAGDSQTVSITAPVSNQTVFVKVTSDVPVTAWAVLDKDIPKEGSSKDSLAKSIASVKDSKEIEFVASIPAKEAFSIMVFSHKSLAKVKVDIISK